MNTILQHIYDAVEWLCRRHGTVHRHIGLQNRLNAFVCRRSNRLVWRGAYDWKRSKIRKPVSTHGIKR